MIRSIALAIGLLLLTGCAQEVTVVDVTFKDEHPEITVKPLVNRWATMSPEEFQFKYDHDAAFKKSVESYSFSSELR